MSFEESLTKILKWVEEKKAIDVKYYDVRERSDYADGIIVCHGSGALHIKAIAENIISKAKEEKIHIYSIEGMKNLSWILLDISDIIVHIFNEETRNYYQLEQLFKIKSKDEIKKEVEDVEKSN